MITLLRIPYPIQKASFVSTGDALKSSFIMIYCHLIGTQFRDLPFKQTDKGKARKAEKQVQKLDMTFHSALHTH